MKKVVDISTQCTDKGEFVKCFGELKNIDDCPLCASFKSYVGSPEVHSFLWIRCIRVVGESI